jgi:hypothetical protein
LRKRRPKGRQVRAKKANVSEPPMECRKRSDDVETGVELLLRDEPERYLLTAQAASGIKAARAWLRLLRGTCEPATSIQGLTDDEPGSLQEGESQAAETARDRVPMRGAGTDRPVVARKPVNAGGAKGVDCPGLLTGQPQGRSR